MSRLVVIPLVLFVAVSGTAFGLAKLHLARPSLSSSGPVQFGDFYNGQTVFSQTCAACHGQDGKGGKIGPRLAGVQISLSRAKAQIDAGGSIMPAGLVKGQQEKDVLAYLATIVKPG
jgi:mono/diheme cytochrome c family protein